MRHLSNPRQAQRLVDRCPDCDPTGRTPGLAADLARATPLREVTLSNVTFAQVWGNGLWYLVVRDDEHWAGPHDLSIGGHETEEAARKALSGRLVALARRLAGLPEPAHWRPGRA